MKTYKVIISEVIDREFEVEATSPEAAEAIAEELREDGEPGIVMDFERLSTDVIEIDPSEKTEWVMNDLTSL